MKRIPLYKKYENTKSIGVYGLCNFGGIEILDILYGIDDYIVSCYNFGTGRQKIRKHKIYYCDNGRSFIRIDNKRYYLDFFMAVK